MFDHPRGRLANFKVSGARSDWLKLQERFVCPSASPCNVQPQQSAKSDLIAPEFAVVCSGQPAVREIQPAAPLNILRLRPFQPLHVRENCGLRCERSITQCNTTSGRFGDCSLADRRSAATAMCLRRFDPRKTSTFDSCLGPPRPVEMSAARYTSGRTAGRNGRRHRQQQLARFR